MVSHRNRAGTPAIARCTMATPHPGRPCRRRRSLDSRIAGRCCRIVLGPGGQSGFVARFARPGGAATPGFDAMPAALKREAA